ncbi:coenzyme Q-binding protein COQ10 homolog B, mitochondrial [Lethenteron reissneri]|uniref:coenzyme Q-binding protein COQ10 homolog B, mitochondrial n=1 Tax=Lethenteron reissneri TaxID=7753 RepID=UPI002AB74D97|nr:coenzyme Q-binding protein COQ10 homolog B, mitochondrial [Lethenteron reissneri]
MSKWVKIVRVACDVGLRPRAGIRYLHSCGILMVSHPGQGSPSLSPVLMRKTNICPVLSPVPARTFLSKLPFGDKRKDYAERHLVGYSKEQMYAIVSNVESYREFVPWCKRSRVTFRRPGFMRAELQVGFPPLVESYSSTVTLVEPHIVRATCTDGRLFNHLETEWRFGRGAPGHPESCTIEFSISFEFRSLLHSQMASMFFDEVVKQMVTAFLRRAAKMYGPQRGLPSGFVMDSVHQP